MPVINVSDSCWSLSIVVAAVDLNLFCRKNEDEEQDESVDFEF